MERCWWRWGPWGVFCRQSTGLAHTLDVQVGGREEPRRTPNLWFEKPADGGGTICKTKRKRRLVGRGETKSFVLPKVDLTVRQTGDEVLSV